MSDNNYDELQSFGDFLNEFYRSFSQPKPIEKKDDDLDIIVHGPLHVPIIDIPSLGLAFINSGDSIGIVIKDEKARERFTGALTNHLLDNSGKGFFIISPEEETEEHIECIEHIIADHF